MTSIYELKKDFIERKNLLNKLQIKLDKRFQSGIKIFMSLFKNKEHKHLSFLSGFVEVENLYKSDMVSSCSELDLLLNEMYYDAIVDPRFTNRKQKKRNIRKMFIFEVSKQIDDDTIKQYKDWSSL